MSCDAVSAFDRDILVECGVEHDIFSWYDGESFDFSENIWLDKSGMIILGFMQNNKIHIYRLLSKCGK